jgi:hypothetical protein
MRFSKCKLCDKVIKRPYQICGYCSWDLYAYYNPIDLKTIDIGDFPISNKNQIIGYQHNLKNLFLLLPDEIKYNIFKYIVNDEYTIYDKSGKPIKIHYNKNYKNCLLVCKTFVPTICIEIFIHSSNQNECIKNCSHKRLFFWFNKSSPISIPSTALPYKKLYGFPLDMGMGMICIDK